jgi:hypothetical protein
MRAFRLSPSGHGVSCDAGGVFVGSIPLLKRTRTNGREIWEPRDCDELSAELGSRFGLPIDASSKAQGIAAAARALNEGAVARAQLVTLHLRIPDPSPLAKAKPSRGEIIAFIRGLYEIDLLKADWDPTKHPRWPKLSPDSQGGRFAPKGEDDTDLGFFDDGGSDTDEDTQVAANDTGRRSAPAMRRAWEKAEGKVWPRDPKTGRYQDVAHFRARADGGSDDPDNYRPLPHDEHVQEHKANGDFSRWARQGGSKGSVSPGTPKPAPEPAPELAPAPEEPLPIEPLPEDPIIIIPE